MIDGVAGKQNILTCRLLWASNIPHVGTTKKGDFSTEEVKPLTGIQVNQSASGVVIVNMFVVKNVQQLVPLATSVTRRGITALNGFLRHLLQTVKPLHLSSVYICHFYIDVIVNCNYHQTRYFMEHYNNSK